MTDEILSVESVVDKSNEPWIIVSYQGKSVTLSLQDSTVRAMGILSAAAYAESEAAVFRFLCPTLPKGFGRPSKEVQMGLEALRLIREQRLPLPPGVNGIYGFNTTLALVDLDYGEFRIQLAIDEVRVHAQGLLEACESARFDAFWYKFGGDNFDLSKEELQVIIQEYKLFKERYAVESLFKL